MKLNNSWIEASYAPSNRATCKGCHLKIAMKDLRLSSCSDAMEMVYQNHFHYDCFSLQKRFKDIEIKDIYHVQSLDKEDQIKVQNKIEKLKLTFGKQKMKGKSSQKETKKTYENEDELDDAKMEQKMSAMLLEGKSKQIKQQSVPSIKKIKGEDQAFNQSPNISSNESDGEDDKIAKLKCYTAAEQKQYIQFRNECQEKTIYQLKEMLKNNDQKCTGTKPELVQRIADCKVLGVIPRCPKCGGGRLQFLQQASIYKCPGFMDDIVFKRCNKTFQLKEVTRTPWKD